MSNNRGPSRKARIAAKTYKAQSDRYARLAALSPEAIADIRERLWGIHVDYATHLSDLHPIVYSQLPSEAGDDSGREPLERPRPLDPDTLATLAETVRNTEHAAWQAEHES